MAALDVVKYERDARGVARIAINRPDVRNAWNPEVVAALHDAVNEASEDGAVRAVVLTGEGGSFSAGGDLRWMRGILDQSSEQRRQDALRIGRMLNAIDSCPKPTIARVNGAAIGGGVGLVCACDVAVADPDALFGLSEVRLGIVPAMISPFVIRRVGVSQARANFMAGRDPIRASEALALGLVHRVAEPDRLDDAVEDEVSTILGAAPGAVAETKRLFRAVAALLSEEASVLAAESLVATWEGNEARRGLSAFLEKRKVVW